MLMKPFEQIQNTYTASKAGFGYDNSVSLQTDDAGHVGAAVLARKVRQHRVAVYFCIFMEAASS